MIRHAFAYTAPINWYPGHMATASRELADRLRGVDLVLDVRDSRVCVCEVVPTPRHGARPMTVVAAQAPFASANPTLGALWQHKPRIVVLNKSDRISRRSQDVRCMSTAHVGCSLTACLVAWQQLSEYFRQQGTHSVFTVAHKGQGVKNVRVHTVCRVDCVYICDAP